jgi:O-antigen ligase
MTELLVISLTGAASLVLAWRDLRWGFAAVCGLLPLYLIRATLPGGLPTTALEAALGGLALAWLWQRGRHRATWQDLPPRLTPWLGPLGLFMGGAVIGTLVAPELAPALGLLRAYFIEPAVFFVIALDLLRAPHDARRPLTMLAISLVFVSAIAVYQKITGDGIPNLIWAAAETRRVTSVYGFPNGIGLFAAPLVVLFGGYAWTLVTARRAQAAVLPGVAAALGLVATIFAVSQGALLGIACGGFAFALTQKRLRLPALLAAAVGLAAVIAVPTLRLEAVALVTLADDSGSVRRLIWGETLRMLADRPVFGAGLSGFQHWYAPYHEAPHIEIFMYPHMLPLNFWAEIGLIGLAGFLWVVGRFFQVSLRQASRSPVALAAACAMVALLVHGLVDVPYFKNDLALLFWFLLALGAAGEASTTTPEGAENTMPGSTD